MNKPIRPFPVLIKALLLFLTINLVYVWIDPSPTFFTSINHILPGFERFPSIFKPVINEDGSVVIEQSVFADLDLLFSSHEIAGTPKTEGEYRVVFFGDSSMWGNGLPPQQTLAGFVNQAGLETCTGQKIRAYNLGRPFQSAMKDLLILSRSDAYNPDMFVWTFSPRAFIDKFQFAFVENNLTDFRNLVAQYNLVSPYKPRESNLEQSFWDKTLWGQRQNLHLQLQFQEIALSRYYFGTDDIRISLLEEIDLSLISDIAKGVGFLGDKKTDNYFSDNSLPFDTLRVASEIADGRPLLLINQPVFAATIDQNKNRINNIFPRWAMDQFSDFMKELSDINHWIFLDYWNLLPQKEFIDFGVHRTAQGNHHFSEALIPLILETACK